MVKMWGPLLSLFAHGHFAYPYPIDLRGFYPLFHPYGWVYEVRRTWHGMQPTARRFVYPPNPRTGNQQGNRAVFLDAVYSWQGLTLAQKDIYNKQKYPPRMSGYNRFIRAYLRGHLPMDIFWGILEKSNGDPTLISTEIDEDIAAHVVADDHVQYIFNAPTLDTRNVIQPAAAGIKALVLKAAASQSDNLLEWQNSDGAVLGGVDERGILFSHGGTTTNVFIGVGAGKLPNTAVQTVAIGNFALDAVTSGDNNVAVGYNALTANTTGSFNLAFGADALRGNVGGQDNVGIGNSALRTNSSGGWNMGIGASALRLNTVGGANVAICAYSLRNSQTGEGNVAIGFGAGRGASLFAGADGNTIIGYQAGYGLAANMDKNVFIGWQAGYSATGSNKLYIANSNTATPLIYGEFDNALLKIHGDLHIQDAKNIVLDTTTGTKIGTAANQKLAFYNATPIVQQAGVAVTAEGVHAALVNLGLITA